MGKSINRTHDTVTRLAQESSNDEKEKLHGINVLINSINYNDISELVEKDKNRTIAEKENSQNYLDSIPVQDTASSHDALHRSRNMIPGRGLKRRSSSVTSDTPKSALDKCMRSKSPNKQKELKAVAATLLKPKFTENIFKVPHSTSTGKSNISSFNKSPSNSSRHVSTFNRSPSSREYITAMSTLSPTEKLSLPNYGLVRPELAFNSPTSSVRSGRSPNISQEGQLKRTVSQLSNGSEFHEDVLPIRIQKASRKLSWPSVKLYDSMTKSISIRNGSNKKLTLRVRIQGAGFSVFPREDMRMLSQEARTFEVKFSPTTVGAAQGELIFELATNSKCMKAVPLFAYAGHTTITVDGTQKGPIGPSFITMGRVRMLNGTMEQQIRLTNVGTLAGFASLWFDSKTKWSDFGTSKSLLTTPSQVRLAPGESKVVNVEYKATKDEIRKIINLNKEVTIVGEICVICGDEPTRLRLLNNRENVPTQILKYLPEKMPHEIEYKRELVPFNESLDRGKSSSLLEQIKVHEIAITLNRNLDESEIIAAELSMGDDTNMSFETFCDTNYNRTVVEMSQVHLNDCVEEEYEEKFVRNYLA